ncbi:hypothetical protein JOE31_002814 [Arthrobacter sp. PvP023]|nr:hypothetical protein [Arthrobacter sp. PvP023]
MQGIGDFTMAENNPLFRTFLAPVLNEIIHEARAT